MPHSIYLANRMLTLMVPGAGALTPPAGLWVALFTTLHGRGGTGGTELTTGTHPGYARQSVTWTGPTSGSLTNPAEIVFVASTSGPWANVAAFGYFDAATNGNFYGGENLPAVRSYTAGQKVSFDANALTVEN